MLSRATCHVCAHQFACFACGQAACHQRAHSALWHLPSGHQHALGYGATAPSAPAVLSPLGLPHRQAVPLEPLACDRAPARAECGLMSTGAGWDASGRRVRRGGCSKCDVFDLCRMGCSDWLRRILLAPLFFVSNSCSAARWGYVKDGRSMRFCIESLTLLTPPFRVSRSYFANHACHCVNDGDVTFCSTYSCRCTALKRCTKGVTSAQNSPSDENAAGFSPKYATSALKDSAHRRCSTCSAASWRSTSYRTNRDTSIFFWPSE